MHLWKLLLDFWTIKTHLSYPFQPRQHGFLCPCVWAPSQSNCTNIVPHGNGAVCKRRYNHGHLENGIWETGTLTQFHELCESSGDYRPKSCRWRQKKELPASPLTQKSNATSNAKSLIVCNTWLWPPSNRTLCTSYSWRVIPWLRRWSRPEIELLMIRYIQWSRVDIWTSIRSRSWVASPNRPRSWTPTFAA